ncbi:MAG TPA: VOC family protein [Candidatus Dormibacteraeota bacterium]|nr:VOC family protein [Candidatus Dormibacteraeota bacterium]
MLRGGHVRLRKIDCVMIRVADARAAAEFYSSVFGLRRLWEDDTAIGLVFPESDAEIVVHTDADIPSDVEVHYLVDDVVEATKAFVAGGCRMLVEPFDIVIGKCAVIADPFGTRLCILDSTRGPRTQAV